MQKDQAAKYPDASFVCQNCASWYKQEDVPTKTYGRVLNNGMLEINYWCDCSDNAEVIDAHEYGDITPYDEVRLETLKQTKSELQKRISDLNIEIANIQGHA